MPDVLMPRLSDSMEEATVVRWLRQEGEAVRPGDELVEIETDKATVVYEAEQGGPLHIVAGEGETVPLSGVIATIGGGPPAAAPAPTTTSPVATANGVGETGGIAVATATVPATVSNGRVAASPIARRLAADLNVELTSLTGSGPRGRVIKRDVLAVADDGGSAAPADPVRSAEVAVAAAPTPASAVVAGDTEQPVSRVQQVIAQRMSESNTSVPDFSVSVDIDMEAAIELRRSMLESRPDSRFSINDLIVKACAAALRRHPRVNGSFGQDRFVLHDAVNVGIAVAAEDALIVPVVRQADRKGLLEIAADSRRLAEAVRSGTVAPDDLTEGTFTVSNLGMLGVDAFTAIVNAPQAAILAVGAIGPRVVARDGQPAVRRCMTVTLCSDHRIIYGADAARFVAEVRDLIQTPMAMML